jgi:hypothetical protein
MPTKVDFKIALKPYYNPSTIGFHITEVPRLSFLMIDGCGDPNISSDYQQAVEVLYSMAYGIKFALKSSGYDHIVPPLEGLWWMENMDEFTLANKSQWKWTMMIMQPDWVTIDVVEKVRINVNKKINSPVVSDTRFESYHEGLVVQTLYTGAYENEAPLIADMHKFIAKHGYQATGKHHEIYLSDPRKMAPEKLKTILRQPIK